ncbi:glycosyltransferase family 4 protein [Proteus genomosp. 6]|uniref:glycosyltransferase family 4 protein n=1 Tax=Proteus genomosp. 6 TaxID=1311820 RepID=UPI000D6887F5|nr:glycosyltransferase family 4 protein [Proteus genomosp. 6]
MKALLLNTSFHPNFGGVENSLRSICNSLYELGWDIDVITSDDGYLPSHEIIFGANIYRYKQRKFGLFLFSLKKLLKEKDTGNYDLIISRHTLTSFSLLLSNINNFHFIVPGVHFFQNKKRGTDFLEKIKFLSNIIIEKYVFNKTPYIYCFSKTMNEQISFYRKNNKEIIQVPPGIDLRRFHPVSEQEKKILRKKHDLPLNKKIVLCLGRFVKVKNFEVVIKMISILNDDYHLILVGDGPLLKNYLELINDLDIKHKITIIKSTSTPEEFYNSSDIFCLPSTYEPFGQVLLEATACHLPVIALNSDFFQTASKEIYKDYNHLITFVDENSAENFKKIIIKIPTKDYDQTQANSFLKEHSWDNLILTIINNEKNNLSKNK